MSREGEKRLFIAATLSERQELTLRKAERELSVQSRKLSPTKPENLHLTLRFIGETERRLAAEIREGFRHLQIGGRSEHTAGIIGYHSLRRNDGLLVYAELAVSQPLIDLTGEIASFLESLGISPEKRPWRAHVTIARRVHLLSPEQPLPVLPVREEAECITNICLFQSEFTSSGMKYTSLASLF